MYLKYVMYRTIPMRLSLFFELEVCDIPLTIHFKAKVPLQILCYFAAS